MSDGKKQSPSFGVTSELDRIKSLQRTCIELGWYFCQRGLTLEQALEKFEGIVKDESGNVVPFMRKDSDRRS